MKPRGFLDIIKWRLTSDRSPWPENLASSYGETPPERFKNQGIHYTVINHSSVLIQVDGVNILTDPIWSERCSPFSWIGPRRVISPGLRLDQLPPIDIILISHNHYDHLDIPTLQKICRKNDPAVLTGMGNAELLEENGIKNTIELIWWQSETQKDLEFHFVPAMHFSGRGLIDRNKTLWGGFVIQTSRGSIYFAGDTGYGGFLKYVNERFGPFALAFLPIGAYRPQWLMQDVHLDPEQAVQVHKELKIERSVGIHFGTFQLSDEPYDEPGRLLQESLAKANMAPESFEVPCFGQSSVFPLA